MTYDYDLNISCLNDIYRWGKKRKISQKVPVLSSKIGANYYKGKYNKFIETGNTAKEVLFSYLVKLNLMYFKCHVF